MTMMTDKNILLVGYRANRDEPGPPFEGSASGKMLDKFIPLWRDHAVVNLYTHRLDETPAVPKFDEAFDASKPSLVVMFGRSVEKELVGNKKHTMLETFEFRGVRAIVVPHPSPRNRVWNDKTMFDKTKTAIEGAL